MLEIEKEIMKSDVDPEVLAMLERIAIEKIENRTREKTKIESAISIASKFIDMGFSFEDISKGTGLSLNQVYDLANSK